MDLATATRPFTNAGAACPITMDAGITGWFGWFDRFGRFGRFDRFTSGRDTIVE